MHVYVRADSSPICDTAECGKGTCSEVPGIIPEVTTSYKCTCDPGWSQPKLLNLTVLPFMPCIIPDCKYLYSRLNLELVLRATVHASVLLLSLLDACRHLRLLVLQLQPLLIERNTPHGP